MRLSLCTMVVRRVHSLPATLSAQTPVIDYHQHLFSPDGRRAGHGNASSPGISARDVIALLDAAGIRRALVLSVAYTWGKASRAPVENEYEHVKAENDWTAQQVAQYPDRLRAFCSFNPLKPYATRGVGAVQQGSAAAPRAKAAFRQFRRRSRQPRDDVAQVRKDLRSG